MINIQSFPDMPQRKDSVSDQLNDLILVANRLGMFDAADAIRQLFDTKKIETLRYGCHCDLEDGAEPDECVIDIGDVNRCIYAKPGMRKEQCREWRIIAVDTHRHI